MSRGGIGQRRSICVINNQIEPIYDIYSTGAKFNFSIFLGPGVPESCPTRSRHYNLGAVNLGPGNEVRIKEIKPQFDHLWVPCPICLTSSTSFDSIHQTDQLIKIVKRKSNLNEKVFEIKYSKIHTPDIARSGSGSGSSSGSSGSSSTGSSSGSSMGSSNHGPDGIIVQRFKQDYIFKGFGEMDENLGQIFSI